MSQVLSTVGNETSATLAGIASCAEAPQLVRRINGGDGGIRTLDTRYQVWLLSRELVSATHPRLRMTHIGCEGRAIATTFAPFKEEIGPFAIPSK